ncbi:polysaccharide deacetylase family protein [Agrococcus citreus]|uniref:NodB homology domain-containing protein n=1 Tax=Agrococcus citreus TaxID=84643 RepID=A0ABN1YMY6_9MICO
MRAARRVLAGLALIASLAMVSCGAPEPGAPGPSTSDAGTSEPGTSERGATTAPASTRPPATGAPSAGQTEPPLAEPSPTPAPRATPSPPPPSPGIPPTPPPGAQQPPTGLPAAWRGIDLERIPTDRRIAALTFDGGSSDAGVAAVLATLDRFDAPATFFVTGAFARTYPAQVRAIAAAGHPVGNHSDRHLAFPDLTDESIRADLAAAEASITTASGLPAMPLFRFPFGARTDHDIRIVNDAGYLPIRWSVDSLGWQGTSGGLSADAVVDRVVRTAVPGHIVLMHVGANPDDGTTLDADALPRIIEQLRDAGYALVDLDELLG